MAKGQIALGKFRGKVGGQVLRVDAGIGQIISEYNPHPSNPRTVAQTNQRNKMNLAGRISKLTSRLAIAGLDPNNRRARSMFVSSILKAATNANVGEDPNNITSSIDFSEIEFSKGVSIPMGVQLLPASDLLTVRITGLNLAGNVVGARVVTIGDNTGIVDFVSVTEVASINQSGPTNVEINVPAEYLGNSDCNVAAYVIPVVENGQGVTTMYNTLVVATESGDAALQTSAVRSLVSAGAFAESYYGGRHDMGV